jgi:single-strand DNA-binding protein
MNDTHVTIVGNILTAPEWRRTAQSNTLVANFKVASTSRRLDRDSGRWIDGNSLRVRVNCWRKLAEGVAASVMVGDPVIVTGRLYTRDWTDEAGNHRTLYELEAVAVGHDLARGRSRFVRNRPTLTTSAAAEAEAENRVHGEPTEAVPDGQAPTSIEDRPLDEEFELPGLPDPHRPSPLDLASRSGLRRVGADHAPATGEPPLDADPDEDDPDDLPGDEQAGSGPWAGPEVGGETLGGTESPGDPSRGDLDAESGDPASGAGLSRARAGAGRRGRARVTAPA